MAMNNLLISIFFSCILAANLNAQDINLQPQPKVFELRNGKIKFSDKSPINISAIHQIEIKASEYCKYLIRTKFKKIKHFTNSEKSDNWSLDIRLIKNQKSIPNTQYYTISFIDSTKSINIQSPSQLGLLYGVVTFTDLLIEKTGFLETNKYLIEDYPTYQRRLFVADPSPKDIHSLFDWALRNKLETIVIASRRHPWNELSENYLSILSEIKKWRDKYGGTEVMQSHNIYDGQDIVISDDEDINSLKKVIKSSYESGINKLMILSDDTPPFKFGEGYILTNDEDKKKFEHFEEANTYLMNELNRWFRAEGMDIESYYVPAFYTYEEMHQGDMSLFVDTPWEDDAFAPFYRDLKYIGKNMNSEIFIIWCGPHVRSRKITIDDLNDWTNNLHDRVPFLWDNTIYSHYPFTSTSLLTAWNNQLPEKFHEITAGNGMFINNDANSETGLVGGITTNDYLWNPDSYDPDKSLEIAIAREYGSQVVDLVISFKETELEIRRALGERKLWFQSDSLWQQIRKVRFITDKNPFYFHLNYSRLKSLRLQLKASVPELEPKDIFTMKMSKIVEKRTLILKKISQINNTTYLRLKKMVEPVPDLQSIK